MLVQDPSKKKEKDVHIETMRQLVEVVKSRLADTTPAADHVIRTISYIVLLSSVPTDETNAANLADEIGELVAQLPSCRAELTRLMPNHGRIDYLLKRGEELAFAQPLDNDSELLWGIDVIDLANAMSELPPDVGVKATWVIYDCLDLLELNPTLFPSLPGLAAERRALENVTNDLLRDVLEAFEGLAKAAALEQAVDAVLDGERLGMTREKMAELVEAMEAAERAATVNS